MNQIKPNKCILPPKRRVIVIGDLHGDWNSTVNCLYRAGVITKELRWVGGDTVVIQMGDQVDRGGRGYNINDENSDLAIINLFADLHLQAMRANGGVYSLIGNHELMNVMGNFTYTSPLGLKEYGGKNGRYQLFKPGGYIAQLLSNRNVIMKIGDWLFVHGGINHNIINNYSIQSINKLMKIYLLGYKKLENNDKFKRLFLEEHSLLWNREFAEDNVNCNNVMKSLKILKSKFMVIGHTPQQNGINSVCNNRLWRVDTGMSQAFGPNNRPRTQMLEILNNGQKINIIRV